MSKDTGGRVPMPMTHHPDYEDRAEMIRSSLGLAGSAILVAETRPTTATYAPPTAVADDPTAVRTLIIKKAAGPAPFVGDPLLYQGWYTWRAAIDELGRYVAGEATLEILQRT